MAAAFEELFAHPATAPVPLVTETPGSGEAEGPCIGRLKKLRRPEASGSGRH
jgi:deoxyribonuclease-4